MPLPRPAPGQGKWWVIGTIGVAFGVALVTWYALSLEAVRITPTVVSRSITSDSETTVSLDIRRPDGQAVTCDVVALDERFAVVGTTPVQVPADGPQTVHREVTLRTTSRPVSADVKNCRATP